MNQPELPLDTSGSVTDLALDIKSEVTAPDGNRYLVSTVQLIFFVNGLPYETMVFPADGSGEPASYEEQFCQRYRTPGGARQGHAHVMAMIAKGSLELV